MRIEMFTRFLASVIPFLFLINGLGGTQAAPPAVFNPSNIVFREAISGLTQPIFITNAGDGSGRLFIVERGGRIKIFKNGALLPTPFLDIRTLVGSTGGEQGLLTVAFHPNYETNGQFYTVYTHPNGTLVLARFVRSTDNPDLADRGSWMPLLTIPHPTYQNHNGGTLAFGPDGYLYWSTGDGGSGGDPSNNAQNLNILLGKILRLDVDHADPGLKYAIPPDNPFRNMPNRRGEIWAYGLRNPWRISFDRQTGDLFIGDVGQSAREEIDFQPAASAGGENYGWRIMEGTLCYNSSSCNTSGKVLPVAEYTHAQGCSVTGGHIYRGSSYPDMQGRYFYADYCSGILFSLYNDPVNGWTVTQVTDTPYLVTSFGEDEQGEIYLTDYGNGKIYQMCYSPTVDFRVDIAGTLRGTLSSCRSQVMPRSFTSVNTGPVRIQSTDALLSVADERVIYRPGGTPASLTEMMGMPDNQLDTMYWFPWYNNIDLDTQLRIGNVSTATASVQVFIGGAEVDGSPFTIAQGGSLRQSFPNVNSGPVQVVSDVPIVAAERVIYRVDGVQVSYSEMMGLPDHQLDTTYWLPWYNNVDLDTQLRIGNVSNTAATVQVFIGGTEVSPPGGISLLAGESTRLSYARRNGGPVQIVSDVPVVVAERVIYKVAGKQTSFSELMALPDGQLDSTYWFPWYKNVDLDTQLRFANVGSSPASVHVYIGGEEMPGSPFALSAGASTRQSFPGVNNGPVEVVSDQPIVAAQRVIYKVSGLNTSFSEMLGLPQAQLDTTYWLPWYNNVDLDTQLRFGSP